jgi:hypothetical protein
MEGTVKRCSVCGSSENEFAYRYENGQKRLRGTCKFCRGEIIRRSLRRPAYRQRLTSRRNERRLEKAAFLYDYLASHQCIECGESDPLVLQFHHLRDKLFGLGSEIREQSLDAIKAEIEKCVVVCGNCHMRKTRLGGKIWTEPPERLARNRRFIYQYLLSHQCVDCGESDPVILEFDHVRGNKIFNIGMECHTSWHRIESEIAKCDIRCTNCHLRRTIMTSTNDKWYKVMKVRGAA